MRRYSTQETVNSGGVYVTIDLEKEHRERKIDRIARRAEAAQRLAKRGKWV